MRNGPSSLINSALILLRQKLHLPKNCARTYGYGLSFRHVEKRCNDEMP